MFHISRKPTARALLLAVLCVWCFAPRTAHALTIVNETGRLVVCTVRSEEAIRPLAQFFVYPGKRHEWMPFGSRAQHWQVSLVAEDNGMYATNLPITVQPASIDHILYVRPGAQKAELDILDTPPPRADGDPNEPGEHPES